MALPIAQLGYLPQLPNAPHVPTTFVKNPWQELAQAVITAAAQQGVQNLMQRDYATQATSESPEKVTAGPFMSPETGQAVQGSQPKTLGPENAGFWSKLVGGPQMGEKSYAQQSAQRMAAGENRADRAVKVSESAKDRAAREEAQKREMLQQAAQFQTTAGQADRRIGLDEKQLSLQQRVADQNALFGGARIDVDRQALAQKGQMDPDTMNRVVGTMANDIYKVQMEQWTKTSALAQATNKPIPPQPTFEQAVMQAAQAAQKFMGVGLISQPNVPQIPLLQNIPGLTQ